MMAVPVANRFGVLDDDNDGEASLGSEMKRRTPTEVDATTVSASKGESSSQLFSPATQNGGLAKSLDNNMTNGSPPAAIKGSSFKAAQMASIDKFNKMVAVKYPELKQEVDIPEKFTCAVCWQIMVRPTHCIPCKHSFCEPCLRSVSSAAKGRFRSLCPYCRQSIHYTTPNQDLENEITNADDVSASEYEKRLKWLEQQKSNAKMPLPGFAPLRWISRICPWSGPRTSKVIDFVERQLFIQFAFFALQLNEDHFSRTPPVLTTIFDLLLVLLFYFASSPSVFLSVQMLEGVSAHLYDEVPSVDKPPERSPGTGDCVFKAAGSGLAYFLPFSGLEGLYGVLYTVYVMMVLRGFIRFVIKDWFDLLHQLNASSIWQRDEDHLSRTPPILTTIIDLLLVLCFYFAIPRNVLLSVDVVGDALVSVGILPERNPKLRECWVDSVGSSILYLLPWPELEVLFIAVYEIIFLTFVTRDFFRFAFRQIFAALRHDRMGIGWYLLFAACFLWFQIFVYECLAKRMLWITSEVPYADSKAGFACLLLGLALLLFLNTSITKRAVKVAALMITLGSFLYVCVCCSVMTSFEASFALKHEDRLTDF